MHVLSCASQLKRIPIRKKKALLSQKGSRWGKYFDKIKTFCCFCVSTKITKNIVFTSIIVFQTATLSQSQTGHLSSAASSCGSFALLYALAVTLCGLVLQRRRHLPRSPVPRDPRRARVGPVHPGMNWRPSEQRQLGACRGCGRGGGRGLQFRRGCRLRRHVLCIREGDGRGKACKL